MNQWPNHWWQGITERIGLLGTVAVLFCILGTVMLVVSLTVPTFYGSTLLQVLGAATLGAGLSALVGAATGREAIHQQSAREANLDRKRNTYGPLYAELKALHAAFSDAQSGAAPAPRWIDVGTGIPFVGFISGPTMKCWPEFKRDYRDTDFSEGARQKLDSIQARVGAYNGAMNAARDPAVHYVAASVDAAVAVLLESDDYKRWQHKQAAQRTNPVPMGHEPKSADDWYGYVDAMAASAVSSPTKQTVGRTIADVWFTNWPASAETATLGWLVGGRPDKAADHAWSKYPAGMLNPPPPLEWIILIFEDAWPAVERDPVFQAALDIAASLFAQVKDTEQDLEAGLRKIQKRYEGGEPLV